MKEQIHNKHTLKENRKFLRNNSTSAEATLWKCLRKRQLCGHKFRRQHSVANYILDFYCPEKHLAVELDGAQHFTNEGKEQDELRSEFLKLYNVKVLRFENKLVFENQETVLNIISNELNKIKT